ncbi:MAG: helix-hairpin-helix domain-containing protein [Candidatus Thorarchaeota archaeon]
MSTDLERLDGIGPSLAQKLIDSGFRTIISIASASPNELQSIEGITSSFAKRLIKSASGQSDGLGLYFRRGKDMIQDYEKQEYLTSGCSSFDELLNGGFCTQKLYEVWGMEGTCKSNLMNQLICTTALPKSKGGLGGGAIYIDTDNALSLNRIRSVAPRFELDPEDVIENISRVSPFNSDALKYICRNELSEELSQTGARLIIVDSIATHFRSEYGSMRQLAPERQQKALQVLQAIKKNARIFNAVAVITNQAVGDPSGYGVGIKHAMGLAVGHASEIRIHLSVKSKSRREIMIYIEKAIDLPNKETVLQITDTGFYDLDTAPKRRVLKRHY